MSDVQKLEGLPGHIAAKELELARCGYSRTRAATPESLQPGEYLLQSAASANGNSPGVRAISWRPN